MEGEIISYKGKRGGFRPGAGKPKGHKAPQTLLVQQAKKNLIDVYMLNQRPINDALITKAREGDIGAIKELHDRVYGKANLAIDLHAKLEQVITATPEALKLVKEYEDKLRERLLLSEDSVALDEGTD